MRVLINEIGRKQLRMSAATAKQIKLFTLLLIQFNTSIRAVNIKARVFFFHRDIPERFSNEQKFISMSKYDCSRNEESLFISMFANKTIRVSVLIIESYETLLNKKNQSNINS